MIIMMRNLLSGVLLFSVLVGCSKEQVDEPLDRGKKEYPGEWMYRQRAFPNNQIDEKIYATAITQAKLARQAARTNGNPWKSVGPVNIGGRITDIALHPLDPDIIYASASNGGVFKSIDHGQTWSHIYVDDGRLSIGNIEVSKSDPDVVYIGTGEANASGSSGAFFGDGLYRSDNGGETWTHLGLEASHYVGRIVIDPNDAYKVFIAATGYLYGKNTTRGIYKSEDGGENWDQILFVNDSTSAIDIAMDPSHPDTLYAAFWDRLRHAEGRDYAGPSSGIYRSFDGGDNWTELTNGLPADPEVGRIGLAVSPLEAGTVYATFTMNAVTNDFAGVYKSVDAGDSWGRIDDGTLEFVEVYASFGWYFGNVRVDPVNPENVYVLGLTTWRSPDGGQSWVQHHDDFVHVDHHALEIHPQNPQFQVLGTDGGIYITEDGGFSWSHVETLPITELYTCAFDPTLPNNYYGGAQDNGTMRTLTGNIDDWGRIFGGDGFVVLVDPVDHDIIYVEYQWGNLWKSYDGGMNWDYSLFGVNGFDRVNWNTPYVMSPHNHNRLYYGTHRLYTTDDGAMNWTLMSDDLTNTDPASPGGEDYGALSTIAVAPSDSNVIYTGSEDGYVYVTFDHGGKWRRISDDLPIRYVTRVAVDPFDANIAYVTISGFRDIDYLPHIFRTDDGGENWQDISGNLPEVPLNDVIVDPEDNSTLYVASDLGVWFTNDLGVSWNPLGTDLPMTSYNDLELHNESRQLLAASFGLSMWVYDLEEEVSGVKSIENPVTALQIFPNPVRDHATIRFHLDHTAEVTLEVNDMLGRQFQLLSVQKMNAGDHSIDWYPDVEAGFYIITTKTSNALASRIVEVIK